MACCRRINDFACPKKKHTSTKLLVEVLDYLLGQGVGGNTEGLFKCQNTECDISGLDNILCYSGHSKQDLCGFVLTSIISVPT